MSEPRIELGRLNGFIFYMRTDEELRLYKIELRLRAIEHKISEAVSRGDPVGDLYLSREKVEAEFYAPTT